MFGRYELHSSPATIAPAFTLDFALEISPRYNVAPTHKSRWCDKKAARRKGSVSYLAA